MDTLNSKIKESRKEKDRIEKLKIIKSFTREYFEELISSGSTESFYIDLCTLLDAIFIYDFHYEGTSLASRMNDHFNKLESNLPKSRVCDDGCGSMVQDNDYENSVVIPEKEKFEHLRDIFNRLRIQRNNIAHCAHEPVEELSSSEMKECLDYVFQLIKEY